MEFLDFVSASAEKLAKYKCRKYAKKNTAPVIDEAEPVIIKNDGSGTFSVGFANSVIAPYSYTDKKYYMAGFRPNNVIKGVHDPQMVSAMWLDCKGDEGIILVSLDAIGLTGHDVKLIRASLSDFCKETGCKYIDISCTHTHAGIDTVGYWGPLPFSGRNEAFMKQLFEAVALVCKKAYANRKSGKLYSGYIHVPEVIRASRYPHALNDRLSRLRFVPDDGSEETWFMNYCAHCDSLGGSNSIVSGDYIHFMRTAINRVKKTNVLFSVGSIASVGIANLSEDRWERSELAGEKLSGAAFNIENDVELKSEISFIQQPFYAPVDNHILALMPMWGVCTSDIVPYKDSKVGVALVTEMTYLKIGHQKILILPGEIFTEIVRGGYADRENSATGRGEEINPVPFIEICEDDNLMIFGVSNDMTGYIVTPNDWMLHPTQPYLNSGKDKFGRNHYNETNSISVRMAGIIENNFKAMVKKI